ncbi:MAG: dihydrofolate reductase [Patescibacteria group bacterium]|nr:dihydrofolate reductase [Patescibacteria group bacterium]
MKCFIIAALTADGYIAKDERHPAFWSSKEDKKRFVELTKRAGVVVMGSTTFATLPRPLKERVNIVYSRTKTFEGAESTEKEPKALLADLEIRGFKEVAICGGAQVYTMFMKAGVVDQLYLTVEPLVFGSGVRLFNDDMLYQLKLMNSSVTENGSVMLEYAVHHGPQKTESSGVLVEERTI